MRNYFKTAVIGGGASGLITAIELLSGDNALKGEDVVVLERNDRVGKKLIATGNGQGNLTNEMVGKDNYYGDFGFISTFISHLNAFSLTEYFSDLGIELVTGTEGKKYPVSKQASAVLDIMRAYLESKNCTVITGQRVKTLTKKGEIFSLQTETDYFTAKTVVMATGGKAGKQFGTDGSAYVLAQNFGHKVSPLYPSLVQLKTDTTYIRALKGLKEHAKVTAIVNGKELSSSIGDLLFTDYGVSGNSVFKISACLADKQNASLKIEFLPDFSHKQLVAIIDKKKAMAHVLLQDVLCGLLNKRIGQAVLKYAKSDKTEDIVTALKDFRLRVNGTLGFDYAQVTKGGIITSDVDDRTYESKLVDGLYIVGEALDVDGDCGGYNLTFAFISGIVCARDIKGKIR